jgi:DNA mismatch repair protein MutL
VPESVEEEIEFVVRLLDETTANRIAAGEVVERPSSVVKELVENALDAGASRVEVELEDGGKRKIVVRDNGCGMGRADAVLSLQRHATSKIRDADDLFAVTTLGFRGEALPSIASVSDFELLTKRQRDESGTRITVRAGEIASVEDVAAPDGTRITVENLFFSVPARLKFLKTTQTELNQSVEFLHRLLLRWHEKAFSLAHDGHEVISYPGDSDPLAAIAAVWGRDVARAMVPIRFDAPSLSVHGFVSKPSVSRATRSSQAFFVNGRAVRSRTVQHAFDQAFKSLMTSERHPVAAVFIDIHPSLVDVNVHPAKTEVRFTRDGDVYAAVHKAIESALLTGGLVPEVSVQTSLPEPVAETIPMSGMGARGSDRLATPLRTSLSGYVALASPQSDDPLLSADSSESGGAPVSQRETVYSRSETASYIGFDGYRIGRLRVLGQARNTYIICETDDAILLVDQHIAHERVLYEQMLSGATERAETWGVVAQHLAVPVTLSLSAQEAKIVVERLAALERAGFILEPFGGNDFVVRAVPASLSGKPYLEVLKEIIDELTFSTLSRKLLVPHEAAIIMASCKMAVKKGDTLTYEEMVRLLADLAAMKNPFTCPHGRPILLALTHAEMDRKFHRTGPH